MTNKDRHEGMKQHIAESLGDMKAVPPGATTRHWVTEHTDPKTGIVTRTEGPKEPWDGKAVGGKAPADDRQEPKAGGQRRNG